MSKLYDEDVSYVANKIENLENAKILISGATGLIGSFLIDVLMKKNACVFALCRNKKRAEEKFCNYLAKENFTLICHDICTPLQVNEKFDYIFHLASNTHPVAYSTQPIDTIVTNVFGTKNLLDITNEHCRFVLASSNEIYGENWGDVEFFDEDYLGYINSNTLRAGYPEAKRLCESLCQAYAKEKNIDVVIARLTRTFGSNILQDDTKAVSQFLKCGVEKRDITLKSSGEQYYSFTYVADAVLGLLIVATKGESKNAYNIAHESCDAKLKDIAQIIAVYCNKKVVFCLPSDSEKLGYSTATKARLCGKKIALLGFAPKYNIKDGICRTLDILCKKF